MSPLITRREAITSLMAVGIVSVVAETMMPNGLRRSAVEPQVDEFTQRIRDILGRDPGGGVFRDVVTRQDGSTVTYTCCWATGIHCSLAEQSYRKRFGDLPEWVRISATSHRGSLCRLAVELGRRLPDELPLNVFSVGDFQ